NDIGEEPELENCPGQFTVEFGCGEAGFGCRDIDQIAAARIDCLGDRLKELCTPSPAEIRERGGRSRSSTRDGVHVGGRAFLGDGWQRLSSARVGACDCSHETPSKWR